MNRRNPPLFDRDQWLPIGYIVGPQGLKGEVRVYPETDFPERFEMPGRRWLCSPDQSEPQPIELLQGRYLNKKGLYVVKLAGITSIEQAEQLRQVTILIQATDRPALADDEYYLPDLVGLDVILQETQQVIGTVVSLVPAGNDLLEVQLNYSSDKALIPFVRAIVPCVRLTKGTLEISPPPGLLPPNPEATDNSA
ncbi:MAG: ribosome maturation factor RimM [Thermosynechococcaceae cyanobacterium]